MAQLDELRLIVRVARMYYEWDVKQAAIAKQLGLSQSTVSRLLQQAKEQGIIRISVSVPQGIYTDLEEELVRRYRLRDAIVVDCGGDGDERFIERQIGAAAAYYLESALRPNEIVGISSWSSTLLALVDAMHPAPRKGDVRVVQILGGVGSPSAEAHAGRLTSRLADLLGGTAIFLPAPGIVGSAAAREAITADQFVRDAMALFEQVTTALVGIGALEPSKLLADSGNRFSMEELEQLRSAGAVGDVLLRFFDAQGAPVVTPLNQRVISMELEQLRMVERSIGVAGGKRKHQAILGALRGGWVNVLVTDHMTAQWLLESARQ
ncbi:MAG TPA: sugar-binding transcriptional regulator [Chloroflexi bacterium]|nr:sugar-binding transcriptional regulator [Chloroflexota bacterium]